MLYVCVFVLYEFSKEIWLWIILRRWRTILDFTNPNVLERTYGVDWLSILG